MLATDGGLAERFWKREFAFQTILVSGLQLAVVIGT